MNSKKSLRNKIREAKSTAWKTLIDDIYRDIWGDGYRIAMRRLSKRPPLTQLTQETTEKVFRHLFPRHGEVIFECPVDEPFVPFTDEELLVAKSRLKSNKAPGPTGIPPEIVKCVAEVNPKHCIALYNSLASEGVFPRQWKRATLVLIKKGNKPANDPGSFRPISLLDVEGKLYEHMLLARLKKELERTGGLAENQFGFREGGQTTDAIQRVVNAAKAAANFVGH